MQQCATRKAGPYEQVLGQQQFSQHRENHEDSNLGSRALLLQRRETLAGLAALALLLQCTPSRAAATAEAGKLTLADVTPEIAPPAPLSARSDALPGVFDACKLFL